MPSLVTLQGHSGGRIPMPAGQSALTLSRHDLSCVLDQIAATHYPRHSRSAVLATLSSDPQAAELLRETAARYLAAAPAAPAVALALPRHLIRRRVSSAC